MQSVASYATVKFVDDIVSCPKCSHKYFKAIWGYILDYFN